MKLEKILRITGEIESVSNLHIGGSADALGIGTMDNPVIKDPVTGEPYIPGSSLKGKMRSLLEQARGKKFVCECDECPICVVFGSLNKNKKRTAPTRLIVRNAKLTDESKQRGQNLKEQQGIGYFHSKTETAINRMSGQANNTTLRPIEFVPGGFRYQLEMSLQIFEGDKEQDFKDLIMEALQGLQETYIGGMGSRGYGQVQLHDVQFHEVKIDGKTLISNT